MVFGIADGLSLPFSEGRLYAHIGLGILLAEIFYSEGMGRGGCWEKKGSLVADDAEYSGGKP